MKDKVKTIWAAMRAHEYGPEPLVITVEKGEVHVETFSSFEPNGADCEGLFCFGKGEDLDSALDSFLMELDETLREDL